MQALFRRGQLKALVDLHSETEGLGGQLAAEEINVIRGALDLTNKTAAKGMTPLENVSSRPSDITSFHVSNPRLRQGRSTAFECCLAKPIALCAPLLDVQAANGHANAQPQRILPFTQCNIAMPLMSVRSLACDRDGLAQEAWLLYSLWCRCGCCRLMRS